MTTATPGGSGIDLDRRDLTLDLFHSGVALNALQLWIPPGAAVLGFLLGYLLWFAQYLRRTRGSLLHARHDADATLRWHYRRGVTDPVALACKWRNPYSRCPEWHRRKIEKAINKG